MFTVLVTGGLGFVGSHISIQLLKKGFNVVIIDSLINSSEEIFGGIKEIFNLEVISPKNKLYFEEIDLRDKQSLNKIFLQFKKIKSPITSVIHCAGLKSIEESVYYPLRYWAINVNSALNLLSVMKFHN